FSLSSRRRHTRLQGDWSSDVCSSNPYFSTRDLTYGVTQSQYDPLGRVTQTTKQDGGISTVSYSDNCTTTTDEARKLRRACTDALGRLIEIDEPTVLPLPVQNNRATMQTDGNLVVYNPAGTALWSTGTSGTGSKIGRASCRERV